MRDYQHAYDIIQKLFWKKQNGKPMNDYYSEFNRLAEKLRQIFLITSDMKQMQNQWNRLMVLIDHIYYSARPQIMRSFDVSSLPRTYFLYNIVLAVSPDTIIAASD